MKLALACAAGASLFAAVPLAAQPGSETIRPDSQSELQWAAGVSKVTDLAQARPDAHLFGVTGGDPAMNGLQTYLSFFESPAEGHRIFRIGDFLDYTVVSQGPNRLVLSVRENYMHGRNDAIGVRYRRLTISWRVRGGGQVPDSISVVSAAAAR